MKNYFVRFIYNQAVVSITVSSNTDDPEAIIGDALVAIQDDIGFFAVDAKDIDIEEF